MATFGEQYGPIPAGPRSLVHWTSAQPGRPSAALAFYVWDSFDEAKQGIALLARQGVTRLPLNFWQAQPTYAAIANGASAPYRAFCSRAIRYSWYSSQ